MPDLRHLRAFVAVAEELNFTRAAERLHMAQQAVSKSVRQLERELGVALLERTTREVGMTPAGEALLASGRRVLAAADAAFEEARSIGAGLRGRVVVGVSPAVGGAVARRAVDALRDGSEDLAVSVRDVRPGEVSRLLATREVDVVLTRTLRDDRDLDSAALTPTPAALVVPSGHRLAGAGPVALDALDGERLMVWSAPGTPFTDLILGRLSAAGAAVVPVESRVTGTRDLGELARLGCVAFVPEGADAGTDVVTVPLVEPFDLPLLLVWRAGPRPAAATRLRERMASVSVSASRSAATARTPR